MKLFRPFPLRPVILALAFAWCGLGAGRAQNVVYELLRDFSSPGLINPRRALTVLNDGTVYGTAQLGGTGSSGGIFKITSGGTYSEPVAFAGVGGTPSGAFPDSELTSDGAGQYWGTTFGGGSASAGTVFRFDPALGTAVTMAELNGLTTGTTRGSSPSPTSRPE